MIPVTRYLTVFLSAALCSSLLGGPVDGLRNYFTALKKRDKEVMLNAIDAPEGYKEQFVKMIDVTSRLSTLSELLNAKYEIAPEDQRGLTQYLPTLERDLLTRKFKVDGDHAESIPKNEKEVPVALVRKNGSWVLDLRKGQSEEALEAQAEILGASYDAIVALLNGLIQKIDTLDTDKFSYDDAWRMVDIQINRKLEALTKKEGEQGGGGKGEQRR
jgi:hypothetical protein